MKRAAIALAILLSAAGVAWLQNTAPAPDMAAFLPSGALLYLQTVDFGRLLRDWNGSNAKRDWLASENYAVFQQSNLFTKLHGVYAEYGAAAGFEPGLSGIGEIAGSESALALYGIHDVEFLYVSRVPKAQWTSAKLWAARGRFERREAAGAPYWLRTDRASGRTVGFAFAKGWLLLATRDDLIARALALLAGGKEPSVASERWYRDTTAGANAAGELRMAMNLDALEKSSYFRSYWVQRNASVVGRYWAGIADVKRSDTEIAESRLFLRRDENPGAGPQAADRAAVAQLAALAPDSAGLYRAWASADAASAVGLIAGKLIAPPAGASESGRYSPGAADLAQAAGTEADLETRIDEPPLPTEATLAESAAPLRDAIEKAGLLAVLEVQSTAPAPPAFVRISCVIVLAASSAWDVAALSRALGGIAEPRWTSAGLGAGWKTAGASDASLREMDGLGKLSLAARGRLLFVANDGDLLGAVLARAAAVAPASATATYEAAFRLARERGPYENLMSALDFAAPIRSGFGLTASATREPAFFSQNVASLGKVLSAAGEIRVTDQDDGARVLQKIVYRLRGGRASR